MAIRHVVQVVLALPKPIPDLVTRARVIVAGVRAKPAIFPSPHPPLPEVDDSIEALDKAHVEASGGATVAYAVRKVAEVALRKKLKALGNHIEWIANTASASPEDAIATVESVGCKVKALGRYNKPKLRARRGRGSGSVVLIAKAGPKNRVFYHWRYSLDGGETWTELQSTNSANTLIENLPVGVTAWFQNRMTIRNVLGEWGSTVTWVVT